MKNTEPHARAGMKYGIIAHGDSGAVAVLDVEFGTKLGMHFWLHRDRL